MKGHWKGEIYFREQLKYIKNCHIDTSHTSFTVEAQLFPEFHARFQNK